MVLTTAMTVRATGAATPAVVWRRWMDLDEWPRWSPQISEVRCVARRLSAGISGEVAGPAGVTASFEVLAVDRRERRWEWRVRAFGLTFLMDHRTEPAERGDHGDHGAEPGTTTSVRIEGFGPAVLVYAPIAALALRRVVRP